jgi:uncharacterized protein (DUF433 family)
MLSERSGVTTVVVVGSSVDFGRGAYGRTEAARIVDIRAKRLRRWLDGERTLRAGAAKFAVRPLIRDGEQPHARLSLSFMDLVETLFVKGFLDAGVPMKVVRVVHAEARHDFATPHPFAVKRFEHDGRTIIERVRNGTEDALVDRYTTNTLIKAVMLPRVRKLAYHDVTDEACRYFPLGANRPVVLDPRRSFGEPTTSRRGVPTRIIFGAYEAGESIEAIERWYNADREEVETAIEYEKAARERPAA